MELGVKTEILIMSACKLLSLWVEKSIKFPKCVMQSGILPKFSMHIIENNHQQVHQIISKVADWKDENSLKFLNSTAYNNMYRQLR